MSLQRFHVGEAEVTLKGDSKLSCTGPLDRLT